MKKWLIISVIVLALVLGIMNLRSWQKKKNIAIRTGENGNGVLMTKPMIPAGTPIVGKVPPIITTTIPTIVEDMATGETSVIPVSHTGVAMPAGFYDY